MHLTDGGPEAKRYYDSREADARKLMAPEHIRNWEQAISGMK
jgi:hypothetical protein